MKRAFDLLDQLRDIVEGEPCPKMTEIAGGNLERLPRSRTVSSGQAATQRLVDDVTEGTPGTPRLRLELGGYIIIQGERRSHALMLGDRHHDVNGDAA